MPASAHRKHSFRPRIEVSCAAAAPAAATPGAAPNMSNPLEIAPYGIPASENIRWHTGFVLSYNTQHKTANWVCEVSRELDRVADWCIIPINSP